MDLEVLDSLIAHARDGKAEQISPVTGGWNNDRCLTGTISGASKVLETAIRVTASGARPAAWAAAATPPRTFFRPSWTIRQTPFATLV
jgi:hypothetical protein